MSPGKQMQQNRSRQKPSPQHEPLLPSVGTRMPLRGKGGQQALLPEITEHNPSVPCCMVSWRVHAQPHATTQQVLHEPLPGAGTPAALRHPVTHVLLLPH